jgi:hypothetical protein
VALQNRPCAYCGTTSCKRTKGHVIPQSLYPASLLRARRITVPECIKCKSIWEDAEPHFRNIMISIWDPDHLAKDNRYDAMRRSLLKYDGRRRWSDFARSLVSIDTPNSQRDVIYPAEDPACNLILRRIVRGLCHFHELGTAIADDRVRCDVMRFIVPEEFRSQFTWQEIAPDFCRYAYAIVDDSDLDSFWLIRFSNHIEFVGIVEASH